MSGLAGIDSVIAAVRQAMAEARPLCAIRLGDGEGRLLGWPLWTRRDILDNSLRYWFGRADYPDGDLRRLAQVLQEAVRKADIVGLPAPGKGPEWDLVRPYCDRLGLLDGQMLASADWHRQMLEGDRFRDLLAGVRHMTIITCRDLAYKLVRTFPDLERCSYYLVPEEAQARTGPNDRGEHWPDQFESIWRTLYVPAPGHLFLVGAGPLGKSYCARIADLGGVGLDIGSVFDAWAGVESRSYLKGQSYSLGGRSCA